MATYYGIEQSTDSRCPRTVVRRLGSGKRGLVRAQEWAAKPSHLTYADAAAARNYHHTLYSAHEMPSGWRAPSKSDLARRARDSSTRDYPRSEADVLASAIQREGDEVAAFTEAVGAAVPS